MHNQKGSSYLIEEGDYFGIPQEYFLYGGYLKPNSECAVAHAEFFEELLDLL
jgi:hypothetical protein